MTIEVHRQAAALALAFLLGIALGLIYDILRPLRHRLGRYAAFDAVFCLIAACSGFVFIMSAGEGRISLWDAVFAGLGFAAYMRVLSPPIYTFLSKALAQAEKIIKWIKNITEKSANYVKFLFQKLIECFIIKDK